MESVKKYAAGRETERPRTLRKRFSGSGRFWLFNTSGETTAVHISGLFLPKRIVCFHPPGFNLKIQKKVILQHNYCFRVEAMLIVWFQIIYCYGTCCPQNNNYIAACSKIEKNHCDVNGILIL